MEGFTNPTPRTVEEVFRDFRGRQAGLIKALTSLCLCSFLFCLIVRKKLLSLWVFCHFVKFDVSGFGLLVHADMVKLYQTCDPGELCLPQCFIHLLTGQLFQSDIVYDE